jgi:heme/copper-type cytochrome/quinol oxidase subunit 2
MAEKKGKKLQNFYNHNTTMNLTLAHIFLSVCLILKNFIVFFRRYIVGENYREEIQHKESTSAIEYNQ